MPGSFDHYAKLERLTVTECKWKAALSMGMGSPPWPKTQHWPLTVFGGVLSQLPHPFRMIMQPQHKRAKCTAMRIPQRRGAKAHSKAMTSKVLRFSGQTQSYTSHTGIVKIQVNLMTIRSHRRAAHEADMHTSAELLPKHVQKRRKAADKSVRVRRLISMVAVKEYPVMLCKPEGCSQRPTPNKSLMQGHHDAEAQTPMRHQETNFLHFVCRVKVKVWTTTRGGRPVFAGPIGFQILTDPVLAVSAVEKFPMGHIDGWCCADCQLQNVLSAASIQHCNMRGPSQTRLRDPDAATL
jgi:hypothetical protein